MFEKIKIYVSSRAERIINSDAEVFGFIKTDGNKINRNAFLSRLIINFYKEFKDSQDSLYKSIKEIIKREMNVENEKSNNLANIISLKINRFSEKEIDDKKNVMISLKPTKATEHIISYINEYELKNYSLSEYFRNMFNAYISYPQDKREIIIFKDQYDNLTKAIKNKKAVFLTLRNPNKQRLELKPYSIAKSKEEIHNYVLGVQSRSAIKTIKLSKIEEVSVLSNDAKFTDSQIKIFTKMELYSPQFTIFDEEESVIELTEHGKTMFRKYYVHRPTPSKIEGNRYYFDCSFDQLEFYFSRFGASAYVISPESLRNRLLEFHIVAERSIRNKMKNN